MKKDATLNAKIAEIIDGFDFGIISNHRKLVLQPLIDFIAQKSAAKQPIRLQFICTHNSRRSHLAQVWAQAAAARFDIENVTCYSGGTQTTALFPVVAEVLQETGFNIQILSPGDNPVYAIKYARNEHPVIGFSKLYDNAFNPDDEFAAIMTCSQADGGCPFIAGAEQRIPVTFEDPKAFDGTPEQKEKYRQSSIQIGTEMCYVFSQINNGNVSK